MAAVSFPLSFAALTGRSGHGLAPYGPHCPAYSLGRLRQQAPAGEGLTEALGQRVLAD